MAKEENIRVEAEVTESLPNAMFRVKLPNGHNPGSHLWQDAHALHPHPPR